MVAANLVSNSLAGMAGALSSMVWVVGFGGDAVLLDILESIVHETSIATVVALAGRAVDELLLGEAWEAALGEVVGSLKSTSGREGPAGAALALVLDGGDGTLGSPVDAVWSITDVDDFHSVGVVWLAFESEELLVLVFGPVHHVVLPEGVLVLAWVGVVLFDHGLVLLEDGLSELVLFQGQVGLSVLVQVGHVLEVAGGGEAEEGGGSKFHLFNIKL